MTYMANRSWTSACALTKFLAILLCVSLLAYADGNTFTRVRYNGGSVASKVDPKDWDNKLTVTPDAITLDFKDQQHLVIPAKSVTSLSYGQEAHRRVGTMIALAVLVAPVALFGLFTRRGCTTSESSTARQMQRMPASCCKATRTITVRCWWRCRG
jgi:hypothetical protein